MRGRVGIEVECADDSVIFAIQVLELLLAVPGFKKIMRAVLRYMTRYERIGFFRRLINGECAQGGGEGKRAARDRPLRRLKRWSAGVAFEANACREGERASRQHDIDWLTWLQRTQPSFLFILFPFPFPFLLPCFPFCPPPFALLPCCPVHIKSLSFSALPPPVPISPSPPLLLSPLQPHQAHESARVSMLEQHLSAGAASLCWSSISLLEQHLSAAPAAAAAASPPLRPASAAPFAAAAAAAAAGESWLGEENTTSATGESTAAGEEGDAVPRATLQLSKEAQAETSCQESGDQASGGDREAETSHEDRGSLVDGAEG
ncbi:unnamed protein product [Closterium sp. NIES-65]|nr:unnamed protein product [Closterium sp. NIES-65]